MSENEDKKDKNYGINAEIVVSGRSEIEKLQQQLEEERIAKEDAESKLQLIAEAQFSKEKERLGAPDYIETPEQLEKFKQEKSENKNPELNPELPNGGSGKAPLSGEPSSKISHVKEYGSFNEMMEDLQKRADSTNKAVAEEAQAIQKQLFEKMMKEQKSHSFEVNIDLHKIIEDKKEKKRGSRNWDSP
jgi:hypothetical protein